VRTTAKFLIPVLAASIALAGCGGGSKSTSSSSTAASQPASTPAGSEASSVVVKTASNAKVKGTILVDSSGMTLYSLSAEGGGKFICTSSACVAVWHPLTASSATPSGANVHSLGVVKRPDGTSQVTYKGRPLYTFAQDRAPGEANGQGFKDVGTWSVVTIAGAPASTSAAPASTTSSGPAATSPPPSTTTSKTEGGGGGYGY